MKKQTKSLKTKGIKYLFTEEETFKFLKSAAIDISVMTISQPFSDPRFLILIIEVLKQSWIHRISNSLLVGMYAGLTALEKLNIHTPYNLVILP